MSLGRRSDDAFARADNGGAGVHVKHGRLGNLPYPVLPFVLSALDDADSCVRRRAGLGSDIGGDERCNLVFANRRGGMGEAFILLLLDRIENAVDGVGDGNDDANHASLMVRYCGRNTVRNIP